MVRTRRPWTRYVQAAAEGQGTRRDTGQPAPRGVIAVDQPGRLTEALRQLIRSREQRAGDSSVTEAGPWHRDYRLLPAAAAAWITAAGVTRLDAPTALFCAVVLIVLAVCSGLGCLNSRRVGRVARACVLPLAVAALVCLPASATIGARTAAPVLAAVQDKSSINAVLRATSDAVMISPDRFTGESRFMVEALLTDGTVDGTAFTAQSPVVVIGPPSWREVLFSDSISAVGRLLPTEPGDRALALMIAQTSPRVSSPTGWTTYPGQLRSDFVHLASEVAGDSGLLSGMVIGDRSTLDEALEQDMQVTGLTHLTAVSGANCSYLLAFVFLGARAFRVPRLPAAALGILALVGFVILVRPEPSVLRAAVMGGLGVVAVLTGRGRVPFALLLLAVVVLLTADPWLQASYAFMLSVAAASGLILFGPVLAARLGRFMPGTAAILLAVPIAAQLFCAPILTLLQPSLPLYSVPANIAATPVVPVVTIVGMAAVALVAVAEPLAVPLVLVAGLGADWVGAVARFFSAAPGAEVPWVGGLPGTVLTGVFSLAIVLAVVSGPRVVAGLRVRAGAGGVQRPRGVRPGDSLEPGGSVRPGDSLQPDGSLRPRGSVRLGDSLQPGGSGQSRGSGRAGGVRPGPRISPRQAGRPRRFAAPVWVAVGVVVGLVGVILWPLTRQSGLAWHVAACDVGQGDAFAVRTGEHEVILVDTGPDPDDVDACLDRLSVTTVDLLVLTHLHADHYGGIEGVFRDRTVERILYSSSEPALPAEVRSATAGGAAAQPIVPERLAEGMSGAHGDAASFGRVSWTVIWPGAGARPQSENNSSAVLEVIIDTPAAGAVSILLTGDLEEDAARVMLRENPGLVQRGVQILKVAHHGAQNGGLELARAVRPRLALISAGRDNDYGHPHPVITTGLSAAGIAVARTDLLGTFLISIQGNSLHVRRPRGGPLCGWSGPWHS